jgi:hypothetical protein
MSFDLAHWPQLLFIALMAAEFLVSCAKHGEPRGTFNGLEKTLNIAFFSWLLWMGGFFS